MITVSISKELVQKVPLITLSCIQSQVITEAINSNLWEQIIRKIKDIAGTLEIEHISRLPAIRSSRQAYKACGKDPARYRLSAEALLRRVVKQKDIFQINNIVDLLNIVSISTGYSIGGYDADKIRGDIEFGIGRIDEEYDAIGRGILNIENLPVFRDSKGAFGSPTSDSVRTSVTTETKQFLMIIIDFGYPKALDEATEIALNLLRQYAGAVNVEINKIAYDSTVK